MELVLPPLRFDLMLPELFLFAWTLLVITFDLVTRRKTGAAVGYLALAGLLGTGVLLATTQFGVGFGPMFVQDQLSLFFKVIFIGAAFMAIGASFGITKERIVNHRGEYFGLILLSTVGMMFLASSVEMLSLYIGLELTTIPLFVLAAYFKDDRRSVEAGIKYMIVGALSSALLLYGISLLYGLGKTTELIPLRLNLAVLQLQNEGDIGIVLILATAMLLAGLGFKLALPPFHQWAPDVYEGSPTPIAAYLSVGSKAAGLVAFAKIMIAGLFAFYDPVMAPNDWGIIAGIFGGVAMIAGNVIAMRQSNIKRLLAYSSIAHAGYIMIGMVAMNDLGLSSVGFYMFTYLFANMGAFAIVTIMEDRTGSCEIKTYGGLARTSPFMAASLSVFLLSLAGIPPLAGFFGKYFVFAAAIKLAGASPDYHWLYWIVGIGLLTSVFALYYYAYIIKTMYFGTGQEAIRPEFSIPGMAVVVIGLLGVFIFGLYPEPILKLASGLSSAVGILAN